MRQILINYAERQRALKRGGDRQRVPLLDTMHAATDCADTLLAVDQALEQLAREDEQLARSPNSASSAASPTPRSPERSASPSGRPGATGRKRNAGSPRCWTIRTTCKATTCSRKSTAISPTPIRRHRWASSRTSETPRFASSTASAGSTSPRVPGRFSADCSPIRRNAFRASAPRRTKMRCTTCTMIYRIRGRRFTQLSRIPRWRSGTPSCAPIASTTPRQKNNR